MLKAFAEWVGLGLWAILAIVEVWGLENCCGRSGWGGWGWEWEDLVMGTVGEEENTLAADIKCNL